MEKIIDTKNLGVHLNPWTSAWMGFDELDIAQKILDLPFTEVRVALRFRDVVKSKDNFKKPNQWDYSRSERLIEEASKKGKKIHFQTGFYKSLGYPESHLGWIFDEYPQLLKKGAKLDQFEDLNKMALEYDFETIRYFLSKYPNIATIQVENEPFSRHLDVSNGRFISRKFNSQEIEVIRLADPLKDTPSQRPIIQNIPWDTPQVILPVLRDPNIDILGLNIYNNVRPSFDLVLWPWVKGVKTAAKLTSKKVIITEYQCSPWLNHNREPEYKFSWDRFYQGLNQLKGTPIFLYDLEVAFYFAQKGDEESQIFLQTLSAQK